MSRDLARAAQGRINVQAVAVQPLPIRAGPADLPEIDASLTVEGDSLSLK